MSIAVKDELCTGCRVCETICSLARWSENNPRKAVIKIHGHFPAPGRYEIRACNQCGDCANVCPTGAIYLEGGTYLVNPDDCTGCGACVPECKLGVIFIPDGEIVPLKCNMCGECIAYCPRKALASA